MMLQLQLLNIAAVVIVDAVAVVNAVEVFNFNAVAIINDAAVAVAIRGHNSFIYWKERNMDK